MLSGYNHVLELSLNVYSILLSSVIKRLTCQWVSSLARAYCKLCSKSSNESTISVLTNYLGTSQTEDKRKVKISCQEARISKSN